MHPQLFKAPNPFVFVICNISWSLRLPLVAQAVNPLSTDTSTGVCFCCSWAFPFQHNLCCPSAKPGGTKGSQDRARVPVVSPFSRASQTVSVLSVGGWTMTLGLVSWPWTPLICPRSSVLLCPPLVLPGQAVPWQTAISVLSPALAVPTAAGQLGWAHGGCASQATESCASRMVSQGLWVAGHPGHWPWRRTGAMWRG